MTAILHEAAPVRYWDHDLGPDELRLLVTAVGPDGADHVSRHRAGGLRSRRGAAIGGRGIRG